MKKPKLVKTDMDISIAKLVRKTDHRILGIWAADCANRVLLYFEEKYPKDNRPRKANTLAFLGKNILSKS